MSFGEDGKTVCKDDAPQNLSLLRKTVPDLIRLDKADTKKANLRRKQKGVAWDDRRMNMLGLTPL